MHREPTDLVVIHRDEALIAVDKPAGLLSVPGRGADRADCVAARLQRTHPDARVVHRLDQATSGVILFAAGAAMQRALGIAFIERRIRKRYVAIVDGLVEGSSGRIDLPLAADWPNRPRQKVDEVHGKPSTTRWSVIARDEVGHRTRLELEPLTGRSHQLRLHLAALGHPIVGDSLYAPPAVAQAASRLLLHAASIALTHPLNGADMRFEARLPF